MKETLHMNSEPVTPWYRQFWPWFLISLPGSVVIAGTITVVLAVMNDDSRVRDNYYKDGLAINQTLAADRLATQLGLAAALQFDGDGHLALRLDGELAPPARLRLQLIHPLDSRRDATVALEHLGGRDYATQLAALPEGRWHLEVDDPADPRWRLRGDAHFAAGATGSALTLHADTPTTTESTQRER